MAKKSSTKSSSKRGFTQRVHELTKRDIFTSIAVVSVLLNVLFLATVLVLTNSDTFSRELYSAAREQYCQNINALEKRAEVIGSTDLAVEERNIDCIGDTFLPFYNEAIEKYRAQSSEEYYLDDTAE